MTDEFPAVAATLERLRREPRRPRFRARPIPPRSLEDSEWWLTKLELARLDDHVLYALLNRWGYKPIPNFDRRKRPLRIKMQSISLEARFREIEITHLRIAGLSFREIASRLGISHVAAWKREQWSNRYHWQLRDYHADCWKTIHEEVDCWAMYYRARAKGHRALQTL